MMTMHVARRALIGAMLTPIVLLFTAAPTRAAATAQEPGGAPARAASAVGPDAAPAAKRLVANRVSAERGSPVIDGRLDEPAWAAAGAASGFVQMRPDPGEPASRRTTARVLYDDDALYVGMRMLDSPDSIDAQLARRDASGIFSDWAHVLVDSYNDRRTAFRFSTTPRGTKKDVLHYDDTAEDLNWDAVWEVATSQDSEGWTAEFRIPLSQLRFSRGSAESTTAPDGTGAAQDEDATADGQTWGINFGREIARHGEWAWWAPVLPGAGGMVSEAGELTGLVGLESPRRLEIRPYSVGRLTRAPAQDGDPFHEPNATAGAAGVDLRYGVTSNFTLSATLNPDFGQVEADPSVVNLSAFESFFPEKRPFFMEGSNIFRFDIGYNDGSGEGLFYSRRIGRTPQRSISADGGWVDRPDATTILGATKLSGKTAGGWTLGVLNAVTAKEFARIASGPGEPRDAPIEPLTSYTVGSVSRDFRRGRSSVGALFTATNRRLDDDGAFDFLNSAAYALGLRGRHRFADGTWEASGYLAGSSIHGDEVAISRAQLAPGRYFQRPDADHVAFDPTRTSLSGLLANVGLWKIGGGNIRGGVGGHLRSPGFYVNDLGFQSQADEGLVFGNLRYQQFEPRWGFRSFSVGLNPSAAWTTGGERKWTQIGSFGNYQLANFWHGGWWIGRYFPAISDDALRGGPAIRRPGGVNYSAWLNGDPRNAIVWRMNLHGGVQQESGSRSFGISPGLTLRPAAWVNVTLQPGINWNRPAWQYVTMAAADDGDEYVFAALEQTTARLTTRLNVTLSPTLSFELYAQPFVSGGDYSGFMRVADPMADSFNDRFDRLTGERIAYDDAAGRYAVDVDGDGEPELGFADPDFNFRQMRGNAVLRWEYLPGSTLYLVWSQERTAFLPGRALDGGSFDLGRDARRLFNDDAAFPTPITNILQIKVDYWLTL